MTCSIALKCIIVSHYCWTISKFRHSNLANSLQKWTYIIKHSFCYCRQKRFFGMLDTTIVTVRRHRSVSLNILFHLRKCLNYVKILKFSSIRDYRLGNICNMKKYTKNLNSFSSIYFYHSWITIKQSCFTVFMWLIQFSIQAILKIFYSNIQARWLTNFE